MDDNLADVPRVRQAHLLPRGAAVQRFIDPVAPRRALPVVGFAGSHPHDRRIRRRHGNRAGRHHGARMIENRREGDTRVDALENSPRGGGDVNDVGLSRRFDHGQIGNAPARRGGSDAAPFQIQLASRD